MEDNKLIATKRKLDSIHYLEQHGIELTTNNAEAVAKSDIIIICVQPGQLPGIAEELKELLEDKLVISTVTRSS